MDLVKRIYVADLNTNTITNTETSETKKIILLSS